MGDRYTDVSDTENRIIIGTIRANALIIREDNIRVTYN